MTKTADNIQKARQLINENAFKEAEKLLLQKIKKENNSIANYLLGFIHHTNLNPVPYFFDEDSKNKEQFQGSKRKAKKYLGYVVDSEKPIEDAFWRFADIEDNKKHAVRILQKGLKSFPKSEILYEYLIRNADKSDIPNIYDKIKEKGIISNTLYFQLYERFWIQKDFETALEIANKIKLRKKDENQILDLIKAFCFLELDEIKNAKSVFQKFIDDDVSQKLNYAQYIGILWCFLKLKQIDEIEVVIEELPNKFNELFVYLGNDLYFNFEKYFNELLDKLEIHLKSDKERKASYAKIRGIKALKKCDFESVNNKVLADLKFAKNNLKNKKIGKFLI